MFFDRVVLCKRWLGCQCSLSANCCLSRSIPEWLVNVEIARLTTQAQRPCPRDATIANHDAMSGSLQRMVRPLTQSTSFCVRYAHRVCVPRDSDLLKGILKRSRRSCSTYFAWRFGISRYVQYTSISSEKSFFFQWSVSLSGILPLPTSEIFKLVVASVKLFRLLFYSNGLAPVAG
jgi:hypothetical protein